MKQTLDCPLDRNLPPSGHPWKRWASSTIYTVAFLFLGIVALLWAFGYRVNWAAASVEQTGILELSSPQAGINPDIYINGVKQEGSLPFGIRWLFAGHYDVEIRKDGYQTWQKLVRIGKNERVYYPSVVLLYAEPRKVTAPNIRIDELMNRRLDNAGIEIRSSNELWVKKEFVTRTSADILSAEYYADERHIIYQAGTKLILRDLVSGISQEVATFAEPKPVPYVVRENGRVVVFAEGETLQALELYEAGGFIERFSRTAGLRGS
ncbi:MAG TPA: PEGA domain-containing protein [Verrucomicrobiae bacterium]|nr:PEGA domain-containing protein [Verrucomicrobiae bacterium]